MDEENQYVENSVFDFIKDLAEHLYFNYTKSWINKLKSYNGFVGFEFKYKDDIGFNASAKHEKDIDILTISTEMILCIQEYMFAVLARTDTFVEIGNPEIENNKKFLSCLFDKDKGECDYLNIPVDEDRAAIAQLLALFALRYIVAHEIGHLINGHVFYMKSVSNSFEIHMYLTDDAKDVAKSVKKKINPLDQRTLEYDADAFATTNGIRNVMDIILNGMQPACLVGRFKLFELWGFAVHTVFLFFDTIYKIDFSEESRYLPNKARQLINILCVKNNIAEFFEGGFFNDEDINLEFIEQMIMDGIAKAEVYFNSFFNSKYNLLSIFDEATTFDYYIEQIQDNWNKNVEPQLRNYARIILCNENMERIPHCQSCWLPLVPDLVFDEGSTENVFGKEANGSINNHYCYLCYIDGAFSSDITMDEMIEMQVPYYSNNNPWVNEYNARRELRRLFPNLIRWKKYE